MAIIIRTRQTVLTRRLPARRASHRPETCPEPCTGIVFRDPAYFCGDPRLGPVVLPRLAFPLDVELSTYARFGNLGPLQFLQKWAKQPDGSYTYPLYHGFMLDINGNPIVSTVMLPVGVKLDRFGAETGYFLSPLGAPFIQRSLPPSALNPVVPGHPCNYHVYQVTKSFKVSMGPIAPWFEQPGGGSQYMANMRVVDLVNNGFLIRLTKSGYTHRRNFANNYTPGP